MAASASRQLTSAFSQKQMVRIRPEPDVEQRRLLSALLAAVQRPIRSFRKRTLAGHSRGAGLRQCRTIELVRANGRFAPEAAAYARRGCHGDVAPYALAGSGLPAGEQGESVAH